MAEISFNVKVSIEVFPEQIDRLLDSPDGPVGILVKGAADEVLKFARLNIGDTFGGHHPGPRLADTGKVVPIGGAAFSVVFDKPTADGKYNVALLHHEGTVGHPISAKSRKKPLFRASPTPTSNIYPDPFGPALNVKHPGHGGNPYLRDAADQVGLRPSGTLLRGRRPAAIFRLRQP